MSLYKQFKSAGAKVTEGIWINYGTCRVKVRYAGRQNKKYAKAMREGTAPYNRLLENKHVRIDDKTAKELEAIHADVFARTILIDWDGVTDDADEEIPFSVDAARQLLKDLPLFFEEIKEVCEDLNRFRDQETEDEAKNSPTS